MAYLCKLFLSIISVLCLIAESYQSTDYGNNTVSSIANDDSIFGHIFEGCSKDPYPPPGSREIKNYQINLDKPPEERWTEVVKAKITEIKAVENLLTKDWGEGTIFIVDFVMTLLYKTLPTELQRELKGIATTSGLSVGRIALFNLYYEFGAICTSIIMEGKDGKMYHGRNLDITLWSLGWDDKNNTWYFTELLQQLIVKVDFFKNGKPLYSAATFATFTGILTGIKKDKFTFTINERYSILGGFVGIAKWFLGYRDASWLGILTRRVMETAESYEQAQQMLADTPLLAPAYFILAGNGSHKGSLITRYQNAMDIWPLGSKYPDQKGSWFLVETNFDHASIIGRLFGVRRKYAVKCMDEIGQAKPLETLYRALSTKPVLNKATVLTALMDVKEGRLDVFERKCADPCWPFGHIP